MVCSGLLGLSGTDGSASTLNSPAWTGNSTNGGNHRSIAQNAGVGTGAADINNQTIRNFSGNGSSNSQQIAMGDFYNAPPTYSWASPGTINEGTYPNNPSFAFSVNTARVPNGAVLTWSITNNSTNYADFVAPTSGSFTVNSNQGAFLITTVADRLTEGDEQFTVTVYRSGGVAVLSGVFTLQDTSLTWYASATYSNPVGEGTTNTVNVATANIPNGYSLYVDWVYLDQTSAASFSSQPTSFVVNNNAGSFTYTTTANNLPNQYLGNFGGVDAYKQYPLTRFRIDIYRDGFPGQGGTLMFQSNQITISDTSIGPTNTITYVGPAYTASQINLDTSYNSSLPTGWSKSGGPYRVCLPNNIVICVPAGADYRGQNATIPIPALTVGGGQPFLDTLFFKVNGIIRGSGGNGANGAQCGYGYVGGPAISISCGSGRGVILQGGSGYIAGGGGGGGGSGAQVGLGGGGAGGGNGGALCGFSSFNSLGSVCLNTNGANGTISGPSNRYRWGGGGGSYLPQQGVPPQRTPYGMGEVGGSGGGAAGYGGGQGGGGGGCWQFTGPGANTIQGGRGGSGASAGGDGRKLINNNLVGAVGGGGGGWGAAGGIGGSVATSFAGLTSTRAGGAGGNAIKLNGASFSIQSRPTIYGAIN
jgi:hypothetical protein